jgi:NADP-dependent 3-hydroxy acid dehydrogenase YdfG
MTKTVLISGATSGIGESCAHKFAANGFNLIITGRRNQKLQEIKETIEKQYKIAVLPLNFNITKRDEVELAIASIPAGFRSVHILINNAGLALGVNPIDKGLLDDWDQMIDTNVKGLLYLSKAVIPMLKENKNSHIINIGSIAGKLVYPNGNVYCATKSAVQSITEGMRIDLIPYGIKVTQVAPGAAETEFSLVRLKGDANAAKRVYDGYQPLTPNDIADAVYFCTTLPPHANINDLVITPTAQANAYVYNKSE